MTRPLSKSRLFAIAVVLIALGTAPAGWAEKKKRAPKETIPFEEAEVFFELNDTDGDLGLHAKVDGGPWKWVRIENPRGKKIFGAQARRGLRQQGLTEFFFESAEPTFDELDPEDFFARFPAGEYKVKGRGLEGEHFRSETELSQVIPSPAGNVTVSGEAAPNGCDGELPEVGSPVIISWDPVTESHPDLGEEGDVEVVQYQVVVEEEEIGISLSVELPPDVTSFEVPEAFIALDEGEGFKFEILVRDDTHNQTAFESCFELE